MENRFADAYQHRKKYSELTAFFRTDVGSLNEVTHIWSYESLSERARIRAEAKTNPNWPPRIQEFIYSQRVESVLHFDFIVAPEHGKIGPFFEIRRDTFRLGVLPRLEEEWRENQVDKEGAPHLVLAGGVEFGQHNTLVHIWAHKTLDARMRPHGTANSTDRWSPPVDIRYLLAQETKIAVPSRSLRRRRASSMDCMFRPYQNGYGILRQ